MNILKSAISDMSKGISDICDVLDKCCDNKCSDKDNALVNECNNVQNDKVAQSDNINQIDCNACNITHITIPDDARQIIDVLYDAGYEAFVVGGCVRDSLLGKEPKDWDITTSAAPEVVKSLFKKTIDTGIQHGTVTVRLNKESYEVTTYRVDGEYKDSRRPESVEFTSNLEEDLLRRDFTINAMAYNDRVGVVDKFNGIEDLNNHVIRCVGNPVERFSEDALRILRAIRFSAQLDFDIDSETKDAIKKLAPTLANISAERIKTEFDKTLMSNHPEKIMDAYELGITKVVLPEYDNLVGVKQETHHHMYDVDKHTIVALKYMSQLHKYVTILDDKDKLMLMWTMLLHDVAKPMCKYYTEQNGEKIAHFKKHDIEGVEVARKICNRLKFDNYTSDKIRSLIKWHDYRFTNKERNMRRAMNKIGSELFDYLFFVKIADTLAQNVETIPSKLADLDRSYSIYRDIISKKQCVSLKELALTGRDLIDIGIKPGRALGEYLNALLEMVIEEPELNTKDILLEKLQNELLDK